MQQKRDSPGEAHPARGPRQAVRVAAAKPGPVGGIRGLVESFYFSASVGVSFEAGLVPRHAMQQLHHACKVGLHASCRSARSRTVPSVCRMS